MKHCVAKFLAVLTVIHFTTYAFFPHHGLKMCVTWIRTFFVVETDKGNNCVIQPTVG